jgi:hypothetical protein
MPDTLTNNQPKSSIAIHSFKQIASHTLLEITFNDEDFDLTLSPDEMLLDYSFNPGVGLQFLYLKLRDLFYWMSKVVA